MEGTSEEEYRGEDGCSRLRFARGGPIFVPDLISPITSISQFKSDIIQQLYSLEAELASTEEFEDELSVDELRVFSEEELVERALNEGFEDAVGDGDTSQSKENAVGDGDTSQSKENASEETANESSIPMEDIICAEDDNLAPFTSLDTSSPIIDKAGTIGKKRKKSNKRGRVFDRDSRAAELEGSYLVKVEEIAKIKHKQDEDKLAARLHSFSGSSLSSKGAAALNRSASMRSLRFITSPVKVNSCDSKEHIPLGYPEVILCVEIYHQKSSSNKKQEFLVLGSQILSDLRDKICCLTDKLMETAGQQDPSGYFLIEDTFYNDMKSRSSIDYSKPIFQWLENCKKEAMEKWDFIMSGELKKIQKELLGDVDLSNLPNFKAMDMRKTRFSDLRFRLGAGYLYCHQGNCKHIMVIRDMRLADREDEQNQAEYPLLTFQTKPRHRKCSVCKIYLATKMTTDDKWTENNPCYFCIKCYFLLHYKEDGTLLYPHSVFDYHHG